MDWPDVRHLPSPGVGVIILLLATTVACGGESRGGAASAEAASAAAPDEPAATLQLGETSYAFPSASCDLTDSRGTGMLLQAFGKTDDGRRTALEVERLKRGDIVHERVTLSVGIGPGAERWTALAEGWPDGRWFGDPAGSQPLDGPLLHVDDGGVTAEGPFSMESGVASRDGVLRARCAG